HTHTVDTDPVHTHIHTQPIHRHLLASLFLLSFLHSFSSLFLQSSFHIPSSIWVNAIFWATDIQCSTRNKSNLARNTSVICNPSHEVKVLSDSGVLVSASNFLLCWRSPCTKTHRTGACFFFLLSFFSFFSLFHSQSVFL